MIKNFLRNKNLVTIVLFAVCIVIIYIFYDYRVDKIINTIKIPVAKVRLDGRTEITEDDIEMVEVASSLISENVITNKQLLIGKYVDYNTFIPEKGVFYSSAVVTWEDMPDSTWSDISEGKTIIYLDIEEGSAYGNSIYPGDRIDLYVKTNYNSKLVYTKFVESIKVLAVKDQNGNHIFKKTASSGRPAQMIFEVDEDMFLLLKSINYLGGTFEIIPVPRNAQYTASNGETEISSEFIKKQVENMSMMLKPDNIEEDANTNIDIVE